jgi:RNA polymerase sigma-70 factor (ECF subfamily)
LVEVVYAQLHRIAKNYLRKERSGHTLQPTALVHESYLRLIGGAPVEFTDRAHFFALVSQVMRRILVDHARSRATARRGSDGQRVTWDANIEIEPSSKPEVVNLLDLDRALDALARENNSLVQLVEMRYFGGMTAEESAAAVGRSVHAVRHDLRLALAWLRRELASGT